ncbi:MAG: hypothetical protein GKR89_27140 [Candidatus Latescibacteria bacterium]|nr:hypothetical protein [Candidatus Latescibacterota bacterium]
MNRYPFALICFLTAWLAGPLLAQDNFLEQGRLLFEEGEYPASIAALENFLATAAPTKTERVQARKYLATAWIMEGQNDQAVGVYQALLRDAPEIDPANLGLPGFSQPAGVFESFSFALTKTLQEERQKRVTRLQGTTHWRAFWRSSALPGWGQRYQGYRQRGYAMLGLTVATVGYAAFAEWTYREARDEYLQAGPGAEFDPLYRRYQDRADRADLALGFVAAAWLFNVIEAAALEPNIVQPAAQLSLQPGPTPLLALKLSL